MSGQIFISYRREESRWSARSLHDRLCRNFDPKQIFMDIDAIALGEDFVKSIEATVAKCDVLIAVIGNNWLTSKDDHGNRRLDNPDDFVRMEIGAALKREISVIPVLVDAALMPRATDLPENLKSLVRRNALRITDTSFDGDCQRLAAAIRLVLEKAATVEQERPVTTLTPSAQPEADKPSAETPKVVHPLAPKPSAQERVKPPSPSSGGIGKKSPSKQVIALLAIGAVLVVAGLIYLANRPSQSLPPQSAPASPSPSQAGIATLTKEDKEEQARRALANATKDHPWINSLEMKFVPVAGTRVLFSVWDTRVQDFETFVKSTDHDATQGMLSLGKDGWKQRGATWDKPGFSQGAKYPVVGVSWDDAKAFCSWLTKREQAEGPLPPKMVYRLPTDEEWSAAVGLKNEVGSTPEEKSGKLQLYPWDIPQKRDKNWPPPAGAGNYAGEEAKNGDWPSEFPVIEGYDDGYPRTSPVGSFEPNFSGLYDMGGNVWQWCEDLY